MEGWIKLHRSFLEHWLCDEYRPLTKREAWETMLFTVNYEERKVLIKGQLYTCGRGQSLLSLQNWADKFVWSIQNVRSFFKLLESDNMIITEGLQYTTRLTICNYDKYQDNQQTDNTPITDEQQTANTPLTDEQQTANTPLTTTKELKEIKNNIIPWRETFENYQNDLKESYIKIVTSKYIERRKTFHPNLDIKKTLAKSIEDFWNTEAGWKNKKQSRSKNIDWERTFNNSISNKLNWVYEKRN
jgi:hypothetical protein